MHLRSQAAIRTLLLLLASTSGFAQPKPQDFESVFEGHVVRLQLPVGYRLEAEAVGQPGTKTFGFTTSPRPDKTRGMVQVSLVDLKRAPAGEVVTLDKFADVMLNGVRQRRTNWKQSDAPATIAGVPAKRIEWSGSSEASPELAGRAPAGMRGVMFVGIKDTLGFVLHTQDFVAFADQALPVGEQALKTFTLRTE